jgi:hypothetical protein
MANKGAPAPKPDARIGDAAVRTAALGEEWLAFTKDQFAVSGARQAELDTLTKGFVDEATAYDTPERRAEAAAKARADVQTAAAAERGATERRMASVGIAPDSGRFAGIQRAVGLGTGLASVDAQNRARQGVEDRGLALKKDAITATSGANRDFMASTDIVGRGFGGATSAQTQSAGTLQNQYNSQLNVWKAEQDMAAENAAGIGKFVGTGLGLIISSKKAKANRKPVKDGAALEAVKEMPVESFDYKPGVGDGERHVGPMAEDFQEATGKGDGATIPVQDIIGLTVKATQDLAAKVERIERAVGLGSPMKKAA